MFEVVSAEKSGFRRAVLATVVGVAILGTSGCAGVRQSLGNSKQSPDEFAVVTKAPLVIPPDFSLRPPKPGARRPQERNSADTAAAAVFNGSGRGGSAAPTDGELILLATAGATDADSSIRDLVDSEFFTIQRTSDSFANKILFWKGETVDPASLVDAEAEAERLRRNEDLGKPATEGETPTMD